MCGLKPRTDEEKAKSLILSLDYEIEGVYHGKSKQELEVIAREIKAGRGYEFNTKEVEEVVDYARQVLGVPPMKLFLDGLKWLGPPLALLFILYLVLFLAK